MCGILLTNKDIKNYNLKHVLEFLEKRGPDSTSVKYIQDYTFIHTLLSMTGPPTEQPFYNNDKSTICIFNGEIYNFEEFGDYKSDGECLVPLYEKYGDEFISKLDGEFAIILMDFSKNKLIYSTDIFGTRPLWIAFDGSEFGISTYKSCLDRIGLTNNYQILANKTVVVDLVKMKIVKEKRIHTFDLTQYKTNNLRTMKYENFNDINCKEYYICISLKNCKFNSNEYFKIRDIMNYYNFVPNIIKCDNYEIFMDLPNIKFVKFGINNFESRVEITNILDITIDKIRDNLFDHKLFDDNYTIYKGINPEVTIYILTIENNQFKYALESVLKQNISCIINIIKNKLPVDALNAMLNGCKTTFYIQVDEDMIFLNSRCAEEMVTFFKSLDMEKYWLNYYNLYDSNFGVTKNKIVGAIKIFNSKLLKKYNLFYDDKNQYAIDRLFREKTKKLNLLTFEKHDILGYHQKNLGKNDMILRLSKISHELTNPLVYTLKYGYNLLQKYLSMYDFDELIFNINYILCTLKLNRNDFFEKINKIKILPIDYNYMPDINKLNISNFDKLKKISVNNSINIKTLDNKPPSFYNIKTDNNFFALVGIIHGIVNSYEYNFTKYDLKQFDML